MLHFALMRYPENTASPYFREEGTPDALKRACVKATQRGAHLRVNGKIGVPRRNERRESDTSGLSCHLNDMKVSACPCDSDVSTVIPLPNEEIGSMTTSSTHAYMKSWRNPGAFRGRVNSTTRQFFNPFCFVVQGFEVHVQTRRVQLKVKGFIQQRKGCVIHIQCHLFGWRVGFCLLFIFGGMQGFALYQNPAGGSILSGETREADF
ncbi:hypothetical protein HPB51_008789 [Rhipicephalus microplus]|uniref:Uncharacterized protein n=1 Tax=Rhipicephalus microplus TaxID=6941 RepID=A0A9J6DTA9_RHIMP|nr:hypothetical protein HPB51_008789 [Rhipicephalus microplus]